jgi:hypothetical protein
MEVRYGGHAWFHGGGYTAPVAWGPLVGAPAVFDVTITFPLAFLDDTYDLTVAFVTAVGSQPLIRSVTPAADHKSIVLHLEGVAGSSGTLNWHAAGPLP